MTRVAFLALWIALTAVPAASFAAEAEHGDAHAAEGGDTHAEHEPLTFTGVISSRDFQGSVFNFLVLIALLVWVIRSKGNPALAERRKEVEAELAEAQRLRAEAERRHMETATRLEKLDEEMIEIRAEMVKAGEAERDRIVEQAEEKAARIRKDTRFLIEQQIKQLRKDLMQQSASAAVAAAQALLEERATEDDQDRLAEAYINRLDEAIEERQR